MPSFKLILSKIPKRYRKSVANNINVNYDQKLEKEQVFGNITTQQNVDGIK